MGEIKLNKNGQNGIIQNGALKGGVKKDQIKDQKLQSMFDFADKNNDGVLDDTELSKMIEILNADNDDTISGKEAKKYLKGSGLKNLKKEDLYKFLQELSLAGENIENSTIQEGQNGEKTVTINYKDNTSVSVKTKPDKSSEISTKDKDGNTTTQLFDANKKLVKTIVKTKDGKTTETEYLEDGKTPKSEVVTDKDGGVSTINYNEGRPSTKTYKKGATVESYTYDENGKEVLNTRVENQGIDAKERVTQFTYNEDFTTTAVTTEIGKTTTQILKDDKMVKETVVEGDNTTVTEVAEDGTKTSKTTDKDGKVLN